MGKVYLVGAGPGDPGLITVRGLDRLREADVVVYDRLVDKRLLAEVRRGAELIYVGKETSSHTLPQSQINALLITKAREGNQVVRLKGGDPFVFGRGGEEAEELVSAGIPFEVVPGVSSAIAAPAYAGIPVTHRNYAASLAIITGREDPTKSDSRIAWEKLATGVGTIICLMGVKNLPYVVEQLVRHGRSPETPVALIRWATWPAQETLTGTLADIVELAATHKFGPPAVTVIGEVVRLRDNLRWFDNRPLFRKRVLVIRTRDQESTLVRLLSDVGAQPVEFQTMQIEPPESWEELDRAVSGLDSYAWIIFTSVNGVRNFFQRLQTLGRDARVLAQARIAAVGPGTADALSGSGICADFIPNTYLSEAVALGLMERGVLGTRVLMAQAAEADEALAGMLKSRGTHVDTVPVCRAMLARDGCQRLQGLLNAEDLDIIAFPSSSSVRNLMSMLADGAPEQLYRLRIACVGAITAAAVRELGLRTDIIAEECTIPGLVRAMEEYYSKGGEHKYYDNQR